MNSSSIFTDFEEIVYPKESRSLDNKNINEFAGFTILENDESEKKDDLKSTKEELLKTSAVLNPENHFSLKSKITSIASTIYYNYFNSNLKFNYETISNPILLFDTCITQKNINLFRFGILSFLYMSYRSDFINLIETGSGNYTTDCGWGCMIRSCQMMLSKALIERKKFIFWENQNELKINDLNDIRKKILVFFLDNNVPIENIICNYDYEFFFQQYSQLCLEDIKYNSLTEIIPPYSIQMICKVGKCAGKFTSDINMIKTFIKINNSIFNEIEMIHFECGSIIKNTIYEKLCCELTCNCNSLDSIKENNENNENNEKNKNSICDKCFDEILLKNEISMENIIIDQKNKKKYNFKKPGIIFISFRLGLNKIYDDYIEIIPKLFSNLHHNIGFVSGKENKAFYFIGFNDNKLLYVDPHLNQTSIKFDLTDILSYSVKDIYLMDIPEISSEITTGVLINSCEDLRLFFNDVKWFIHFYPFFLKIN